MYVSKKQLLKIIGEQLARIIELEGRLERAEEILASDQKTKAKC